MASKKKKNKQYKFYVGKPGRPSQHVDDIKKHFELAKRDRAHCYDDDWQDWFSSGFRYCHEHAVPIEWHLLQRLDCPRCSNRGVMRDWQNK